MNSIIVFIIDLIFDHLRSVYVKKLDARQAWLYTENFKNLKYNYDAVERNIFNVCLLLKRFDNNLRIKTTYKKFLRNVSIWRFAFTSEELKLAQEYFDNDVRKLNDALIKTTLRSLPGCFKYFKFEEFRRFVDWTDYCVDDQLNDDDALDLYFENVEILKWNIEVFSAMLPTVSSQFVLQEKIETMISNYNIIFGYCSNQKQISRNLTDFLFSAKKSMRFIKSRLPKDYRNIKFAPFVNQKNLASRY